MEHSERISIQPLILEDDGVYPGHPDLPLLIYGGAFAPLGPRPAEQVERHFDDHGWPAAWRNGVYSFQHYHSAAHEALGVYRGRAEVQFGGPGGPRIQVLAGDAVVLPAGAAHKLIEASRNFAVVGAYPPGQVPDMCYGRQGERPGADQRIARVPLPLSDPVLGTSGGIMRYWRRRTGDG